jgi:ribosomal protein L22
MTEKPDDLEPQAEAEETAPASNAARSTEPEASEASEESRAASEADADSSSAAEDEAAQPVAEEGQEPEAAEEGQESGAAEEAPKPRRRRRKAAEPVAEGAEAAETEVAEAEETEAVAAEAAGAGADAPEADVEEPPAEPARPTRAAPSRRRARRDPNLPAPVVRAQAKYVRSSARKARLVCDHIRGKSVEEARAILALTPRAIARDWSKLLESAVANAEHNHELVGEDLYVKAVHADEGPTIKRFRPRAMGRATRIRKRTSHLTILLTPRD